MNQPIIPILDESSSSLSSSQTGLKEPKVIFTTPSDSQYKRKFKTKSPTTTIRPHSYPRSSQDQKKIDHEEEIRDLVLQTQQTSISNGNSNGCKHEQKENVNGQEICVDCGLHLGDLIDEDQEWRYYGNGDNKNSSDPSRVQFRKNPDKGIRKDLEKLLIPSQIANLADQYYFEVTNGDIKRGNLRKGIMFACVFEACKALDKPQTPDQLQKLFCIEKKDMSQGLTYFAFGRPKSEKKYITPEHYIPKTCAKFKFKQDVVEEVLNLYHTIKKSSSLNHSYPESVSSGCIYYVLKNKNINISAYEFGKMVGLSDITITKKANEIEEILSNMDYQAPSSN